MAAVEDSETELLHTIIGLHRQLIYASLTAEVGTETELSTRQKTLALLNLDQPPTVTRSEHLALGVIYMLCDRRDLISGEGMDIVRAVTRDGHDMLHLAVVLGLKTLVRELARHLLGTFQSSTITSGNEVFTRDSNDLTDRGGADSDTTRCTRPQAICTWPSSSTIAIYTPTTAIFVDTDAATSKTF
ncbi:hypothetical protein BGX24_005898 [Mortierella sp. AD032]|nr:hypothetical protein BGX24_005898 [Mortierella sp. AD032]